MLNTEARLMTRRATGEASSTLNSDGGRDRHGRGMVGAHGPFFHGEDKSKRFCAIVSTFKCPPLNVMTGDLRVWEPHTRFTGEMLVWATACLSNRLLPEIADIVLEHVVARDVLTFWTWEFQGARTPISRRAWLADIELRRWVLQGHRPWARLWVPHGGAVALRCDVGTKRKRGDPCLPGFRVVKLGQTR